MTKFVSCYCCRGPLEPVQQLRFLVETDTLNEPAHLARIRVLPSISGKPLPVCKACQPHFKAAPRPTVKPVRPAATPKLPRLLGALGALSVGLVLTNLLMPRG